MIKYGKYEWEVLKAINENPNIFPTKPSEYSTVNLFVKNNLIKQVLMKDPKTSLTYWGNFLTFYGKWILFHLERKYNRIE